MLQLDLTEEARAYDLQLDAPLDLTEPERLSAIETWKGRMLNEHVSARVFAAIVGQMMAAGLSATKQEAVAGMIQDELRHGRQCAAVVYALGGAPVMDLPDLQAVPEHRDVDPLEGVLRNILSISCLSETIAVSLITAEREQTGPAPLAAVLKQILADEVQHARFGWALMEEVHESLSPELKSRLSDYLVYAFAHLRAHELAHLPINATPSDEAVAYGVCDGNDARDLFFQTVEDVIIPRLEGFGFRAQLAWQASFKLDQIQD